MTDKLIPLPSAELIKASEAPFMLGKVRPAWQARSLIERVKKLLDVDPSSACQRLLNAAIHDLREKVSIAGLDIAAEAARQNGLPPVSKSEDVENYPTAKLIDLAYRIGLHGPSGAESTDATRFVGILNTKTMSTRPALRTASTSSRRASRLYWLATPSTFSGSLMSRLWSNKPRLPRPQRHCFRTTKGPRNHGKRRSASC
ncbi:MAG: hypothetical protein JWO69_2062 [Thermoleophilia bacterium]|nr:hypothetical protein [Thermoleophilia bacterium]